MNLIPWRNKNKQNETYDIEPYDMMDRFRSEMDRTFDRLFGGLAGRDGGSMMQTFAPSLDVTETDTEFVVRAEVPGMEPKDIDITITGQQLVLSGEKKESSERKGENFFHSERRFGSFRRSITLPSTVDVERVAAEHKNGVVHITLKKREGAQPKKITVQAKK